MSDARWPHPSRAVTVALAIGGLGVALTLARWFVCLPRLAFVLSLAFATAALALPAQASADTQWTKISSDYFSSITVPEIGILGSTAVVTWEQDTSPSTEDSSVPLTLEA